MLKIKTFGSFEVVLDGIKISDESHRSSKMWKMFKYLITNRRRTVTNEDLVDVLWPDGGTIKDPVKSLQAIVVRLRKQLGGGRGAYILSRQHGYAWNQDTEFRLDTAEFEEYITALALEKDTDARAVILKKITDVYSGDYLPDSAGESWVSPAAIYYRRKHIAAVFELADFYENKYRYDHLIDLCRQAVSVDPYNEELFERFIQALLLNGEKAEAQKQYKNITALIKKEFGTDVSDSLKVLAGEINTSPENAPADIFCVKDRLNISVSRRGVYLCTAEIFRQIYAIDKRSGERIGFPVFLALVTLMQNNGCPDEKELKAAMRNLRNCLIKTLRSGEVVSRYSNSQYVMILSAKCQCDIEAIFTRVKRVYALENPNCPFYLHCSFCSV